MSGSGKSGLQKDSQKKPTYGSAAGPSNDLRNPLFSEQPPNGSDVPPPNGSKNGETVTSEHSSLNRGLLCSEYLLPL